MELVAAKERGQMKKYLGTVFSREKFRGVYHRSAQVSAFTLLAI